MAVRKYWLQLPQTYFSRLSQRKMRKQPNGEIMQIVLLKNVVMRNIRAGCYQSGQKGVKSRHESCKIAPAQKSALTRVDALMRASNQ